MSIVVTLAVILMAGQDQHNWSPFGQKDTFDFEGETYKIQRRGDYAIVTGSGTRSENPERIFRRIHAAESFSGCRVVHSSPMYPSITAVLLDCSEPVPNTLQSSPAPEPAPAPAPAPAPQAQ